MSSEIERRRPVKMFRAKVAFGPYIKGALLQPTGPYRQVLLGRGWIEEVPEEAAPPIPEEELTLANLSDAGIGVEAAGAAEPFGLVTSARPRRRNGSA